jgi:anti-anti-sigma factor
LAAPSWAANDVEPRAGRLAAKLMVRIDANPLRDFFVNRLSEGDLDVIEIGGECDGSTLAEVNDALRQAPGRPARDVIVDLKHATFVDSLTLASLTAAAKQVRATGRSFGVIGAEAPAVRRAFELTGLDTYLFAEQADSGEARSSRP